MGLGVSVVCGGLLLAKGLLLSEVRKEVDLDFWGRRSWALYPWAGRLEEPCWVSNGNRIARPDVTHAQGRAGNIQR